MPTPSAVPFPSSAYDDDAANLPRGGPHGLDRPHRLEGRPRQAAAARAAGDPGAVPRDLQAHRRHRLHHRHAGQGGPAAGDRLPGLPGRSRGAAADPGGRVDAAGGHRPGREHGRRLVAGAHQPVFLDQRHRRLGARAAGHVPGQRAGAGSAGRRAPGATAWAAPAGGSTSSGYARPAVRRLPETAPARPRAPAHRSSPGRARCRRSWPSSPALAESGSRRGKGALP
jgi:hypothetical protein